MTARSWDALTVVLPEPVQIFGQGNADLVDSNVSFRIEANESISTLLNPGAFAPNGRIQGLFYIPDLNASDSCAEFSSPFLPQNVTRRANIPTFDDYPLVALAPWLSDHPECARPYMQATQADRGRALIFFPTRPNADIATPVFDTPDWGVNESTWVDWVSDAGYPIWAIPSDIGARLVQEMGKYSGNVSVSPFGATLNQTYPPEDAIRLFARVVLRSEGDTNPILGRLWVFAIMILAILCIVTGLTSLIMHFNQRRMRRDLRRRIANGEVDLEVLGIKRQKVPQKLLDKMPLYVYTSKLAPPTSTEKKETPSPPQNPSFVQRKTLPKRDFAFSQATCPICLDDFEHNETIVRELPCQHIFHPECVDEFLRSNSSLCPMCKKSALPTGYCPENITISMVRRERMIRRLRQGEFGPRTLSSVIPASAQRFLPNWLLRLRARPRQGAERLQSRTHQSIMPPPPPPPQQQQQQEAITSTMANATPPVIYPLPSPSSTPPPTDLEMGTFQPAESHPRTLEELPPDIQALSPEERREWGRQRLAATLPPVQTPAEDELSAQRISRFKRVWRKAFPR